MNIADLSKIDLKDLNKINYAALLQDLRKQPEVLAIVVAVLITIIIGFNVFLRNQDDLAKIRTEKSALETKVKKIDDYVTAKEELAGFLGKIKQQVTETQFVGLITDLANSHGVQINSLTPHAGESTDYFDSLRIDLSVSTKTYQDMWLFVHDIEKTDLYYIRVDEWSGSMEYDEKANQQQSSASKTETDDKVIKARLRIIAVNIKSS